MSNAALSRGWSLALPFLTGGAVAVALSVALALWHGADELGSAAPFISASTAPPVVASLRVERATPTPSTKVSALALSPDGAWLGSTGEDGVIRVRSTATGAEVLALKGHGGRPGTALTFSGDSRQVISGGLDSEVHAWDIASQKGTLNLRAHEHGVQAVSISADGSLIASAGQETRIMLWAAGSGQLEAILSGHGDFVNDLAFSPDGTRLASAGADRRVLLWDVGAKKVALELSGHAAAVEKVRFVDASTLITADSEGAVILWDLSSGRERERLVGHRTSVTAMAVSPSGEKLATASDDNQVLVWDIPSGKVLESFSGPSGAVGSLLFGANGQLLVGGLRNDVSEWDANRGASPTAWTAKN